MVSADLLDTLTDVGAIGGIAAIIGTGLLILLVASQARELRAMRDWIDGEPERQQEITQHVIAEVQRRIAAARERRQAATPPVAPPVSTPPPAPKPPAPGTLGATPEARKLAEGNELVPPPTLPGQDETEIHPAFGAATPAGAAGDAPRFAPLTPAEQDAEDDDVPAVVAEFTSQETVAADVLQDQEEDELDVPPFTTHTAAAGRSRDVRFDDEHFDFDEEPPRRSNKLLVGGGILALLVGIILLASQLFGGGDDPTPSADETPQEQTDTAGATSPDEPPRIEPSTVTVQVLNGTTVTGLAQRITDRIKNRGYGTGQPETASGGQTQTATTVSYREGQRDAAEQLAEDLGLGSGAVQAMSAETAAAIGDTFEIVVTAGTDLDGTASSGTSG